MSDPQYRLTCQRFDQIVKRHPVTERPIKLKKHRFGDLVEGLDEYEIERLLKAGAIARVGEEAPQRPPVPASTAMSPADAAAAIAAQQARESGEVPTQTPVAAPKAAAEVSPELPLPTAPKADWVAHVAAVTNTDAAEVDKMTKDQLMELASKSGS